MKYIKLTKEKVAFAPLFLFYQSDFKRLIAELQNSSSNSLQDQHNLVIARYLLNPEDNEHKKFNFII